MLDLDLWTVGTKYIIQNISKSLTRKECKQWLNYWVFWAESNHINIPSRRLIRSMITSEMYSLYGIQRTRLTFLHRILNLWHQCHQITDWFFYFSVIIDAIFSIHTRCTTIGPITLPPNTAIPTVTTAFFYIYYSFLFILLLP